MAVEMAKLSLWLITLQRDRPFTFLDHALKCGDSLLGVSSVQQIENFSLRPGERQVTFATANLFRYVDEASAKRRALEDLPSNDHTQIETKNRLHAEAEAATAKVKAIADCLIALELRGLDGDAYEDQRTDEAEKVQLLMKRDADASLKSQTPTINQLSAHARERLYGRRPFHWPVEFPEVFARGGFDAFVGNPPFMGGLRIDERLGVGLRDYLVEHLAGGSRATADLCAYFFLRAQFLLHRSGNIGLIATNTIAQGDTREVALQQMLAAGSTVYRATSSRRWPGLASVEIAEVWVSRTKWMGTFVLDDVPVQSISSYLTAGDGDSEPPKPLACNQGKSFQGSNMLGLGFTMLPSEAEKLISTENKNKEVLFPYLNGSDLNSHPEQQSSRWVIFFRDWPLNSETAPDGYSGPVAADYPACLKIVEEKVKPERASNNDPRRRNIWWQFTRPTNDLYSTVARLKQVLVLAQLSRTVAFSFVPKGWVYSHRTIVFAFDTFEHFSTLQSAMHVEWAWRYSSTLKTDLSYVPSDCFQTFPFPIFSESTAALAASVGQSLHEFRRQIMSQRQQGLTDTYNRFHDRAEQSADIAGLRALHVEMDQAVAAAYGWSDLDLGHGFHATKQGERYTLSESARRTVLDRLLALNQQRYAEEVAAGLHEKGAKKGKGRKAKASEPNPTAPISRPQMDLL
jgi:hypothetical protein